MVRVTKTKINEFLSAKRIAVIGASRNNKEFSRYLFRELLKNGYDAIPVNPNTEEMDGRKCFKNIRDINPTPERALILLPKDKAEQAVLDCDEAGVKNIWLHRHLAGGVSDTQTVSCAEEKNLNLITGYCLLMFLPKSASFHKFHGQILKFIGKYPN